MARTTKPINLISEQCEILQAIARSREISHSLVQRAQIILEAADGLNNKTISTNLGICEETVGMWRRRWISGDTELNKAGNNPKKLRAVVSELLADLPRPGCPITFSSEQVCQIVALACEVPPEHCSHWTRHELRREAIKRNITETVSATTIGRFLKSGRPQAASHPILVES